MVTAHTQKNPQWVDSFLVTSLDKERMGDQPQLFRMATPCEVTAEQQFSVGLSPER